MTNDCPTPEEIDAFAPWHYQVEFPNGHRTAGGIVTDSSWYFKPSTDFEGFDVSGKSVFEVGPCSGHMTRLMAGRGAVVTSLDVDLDNIMRTGMYLDAWGCEAELRVGSIEDIEPGQFLRDVVTFTGVLYHLRRPLQGMYNAWSCAREAMCCQSHLYPGEGGNFMKYQPGYMNDPTCWWFPTRSCLRAMIGDLPGVGRVQYVPEASSETSGTFWAWRK
jgi:hypothetical protein